MSRFRLAFALALALSACPPPVVEEPDAGTIEWVHDCASSEAALAGVDSDSDGVGDCVLPLGPDGRTSYLTKPGTVDWWLLDIPEPLPPRALLTVTALYKAPSTPVVINVNVLKPDAKTSLASATDPRRASSTSAGGPGPAQAVSRLTEAGKYFVVVRHDTSADDPAIDKKNPYTVTANVASDPDTNEPNDTSDKATAIPGVPCGSFTTATGALSTTGDVDKFAFDVSQCGGGRTILVVRMEAPASPVVQLRLNYVLKGPAGTVSTDYSKTPMKDQLVATARISSAGKYELTVNAYKGPKDIADPPGDLTFTYKVSVGLFPDQDTNEGSTGNDSSDTATPTGLSAGASKVFAGRLSYTGDNDIYAISASGSPTRLYYRLDYTRNAGQFPAVPTLVPKQMTVFQVDKSAECVSKCGGDPVYTVPWCQRGQCVHNVRTEDSKISDYGNFEGQLFMPANSGTWYVQLGYTGAEGGDDIPYNLTLEVKPGQAPTTAASPHVVNLPSEGTTVIGWGWGGMGSGVPNPLPELPRNFAGDYDKAHQVEYFEFHFSPPTQPLPPEPPIDQSFKLQWKIDPPGGSGQGRAYDIAFKMTFCKDAGCTQKTPMPGGGYLGYSGGETNPWYVGTTDAGLPGMQRSYTFDSGTGTFSQKPAMCTCVDSAHLASGVFRVQLEAINRTSYEDSTIHLQFGLSSYPVSATNDEGTTFTCPSPCGWVGSY